MRHTLLIATTLFAFASAPAFAAVGTLNTQAGLTANTSGQLITKIAGPCGPGQAPTGSTSGAKGGCEAIPNAQGGVIVAPPLTKPCGPGSRPTGSTSGSKSGCEAIPTAAGTQPIATKPQLAPCGPNETPTSSTSGAKGGCVAKP